MKSVAPYVFVACLVAGIFAAWLIAGLVVLIAGLLATIPQNDIIGFCVITFAGVLIGTGLYSEWKKHL